MTPGDPPTARLEDAGLTNQFVTLRSAAVSCDCSEEEAVSKSAASLEPAVLTEQISAEGHPRRVAAEAGEPPPAPIDYATVEFGAVAEPLPAQRSRSAVMHLSMSHWPRE